MFSTKKSIFIIVIKKVYIKNNEIIVEKSVIYKRHFRNKIIKTLLINDKYILTSKDLILYECDRTHKIIKTNFKLNDRYTGKKTYCAEIYKKINNLKKYGVDNPTKLIEIKKKISSTKKNYSKEQKDLIQKKRKQTTLKKYGVEYCSQNKTIRQKIKKSYIKSYGVDNPNKSIIVRNKIENTCLKKYGIKCVFQDKEKMKKRIKEKYGVENISQNKEISIKSGLIQKLNFYKSILNGNRNKLSKPLFTEQEYIGVENSYKWQCNKCNSIFTDTLYAGRIPRCPICFPKNKSKYEYEIIKFINSFGILVESNKKSKKLIYPYELDVFLPEFNLAIEFDGLYWHSEKMIKNDYHLKKTELCEQKGIRLIHIFEDEWIEKQEIVEAKLKDILGLNTKKINVEECQIRKINSKVKSTFLLKYHIQGDNKSTINLGAYYKNTLIGVMTFLEKKPKKNTYELCRFAVIHNTYISGLAKKILYFFIKNNHPKLIYGHADRRWSQGNLYKAMEFTLDKITKPNYWYVLNNKRIHRSNFRKKSYSSRIWDCGNYKFNYSP